MLLLTGEQLQLPNIGTSVENIFLPVASAQILPPYDVTVYTIDGQTVSAQYNVEQVDLNNLNHGMYLIQYEKNGQRVVEKIVR